jgi:hypothetical protein
MTRAEARRLVNYLARQVQRGYTIVTWNGVGFDFDILAEETGMLKRCQQLAADHIDMMFHTLCLLGHGVSLDAVTRGMNLRGKSEGISGALAPVFWADRRRREVLEYVARDVQVTLGLAQACDACGFLRWITRNGLRREMRLPHGWLIVKAARRLPEAGTPKTGGQWSRRRFIDWLDPMPK